MSQTWKLSTADPIGEAAPTFLRGSRMNGFIDVHGNADATRDSRCRASTGTQ